MRSSSRPGKAPSCCKGLQLASHAPMVSHDAGLEKLSQRSRALNGVPTSTRRIIAPKIKNSRADHAQGLTVLRYLFGASKSSHAVKTSVTASRGRQERDRGGVGHGHAVCTSTTAASNLEFCCLLYLLIVASASSGRRYLFKSLSRQLQKAVGQLYQSSVESVTIFLLN